jgi:endonuclease/exonuclease/phosphatase family metal-dependent hydrolase
MRIVSANLHAGVDGWGHATGALEAVLATNPDLLITPETWQGPVEDFVARLEAAGLRGVFVPLAQADRSTTAPQRRTWQPRLGHFTGERGLYFHEHRAYTAQQLRSRAAQRLERGTWGLALFTNREIVESRVIDLGRRSRERVRRSLIVATLRDGEQTFYAVALHGAHLSHGSHVLYRQVRRILDDLSPTLPIILAGDFNCWRPLLRTMLPGWRGLVRAKTWPVHLPHSQIDHILARGPWRTSGGRAFATGSDHLALYVEATLEQVESGALR